MIQRTGIYNSPIGASSLGHFPMRRSAVWANAALEEDQSESTATQFLEVLYKAFFGASVVVICGVVFGLFSTVRNGSAVVTGQELKQILATVHSGPSVRQQMLERMTHTIKNEISSETRYISEIIQRANSNVENPAQLAQAIVKYSRKHNYDPLFIAAIIKSESTFKHRVASNVGALGLMQIMPDTGRYISDKLNVSWHGAAQLSDPEINIQLGIAYLRYLENYFDGDIRKVLIAYNWGPGNLLEAMKNGRTIPTGPAVYAKKIISNYERWRSDLDLTFAQNEAVSSAAFVG